jgi:hypothetical protein
MPDMLRRGGVLGGLAALAGSALPFKAAALGAFSSDRITVTVEGNGQKWKRMGSGFSAWRCDSVKISTSSAAMPTA